MLKVDLFDLQSIKRLVGYYVWNHAASYYTKSGNALGVWFGRGARALGLKGPVTAKQLENVFLGRSPDGLKQLVKIRTRPPKPIKGEKQADDEVIDKVEEKEPELHVPGYDITFSLPKSVAVLWAIGGPELRATIERIFRESVQETLQWMEDNLKLARRGKGGEFEMFGDLVIAMFEHDTARNNQDPLPHIHCAIANLLLGRDDEKWSKVNSQMLLKWFRTLGPMQRNTFLKKLDDEVGVEAVRPFLNGKVESWFEIDGVSPELIGHWSSRRKEILDQAELLGKGRSSSVRARQNANLRTRRPKGTGLNRDELEQKWKSDAAAFGVTQESLKSVIGRHKEVDVEARVELALKEAIDLCLDNRTYFTRQKYIQRVSESLQDVPISGAEVVERADRALQQSESIKPIQAKESKELVYTTPEVWKIEEKLLAKVEEMKNKKGPKISQKIIERTLKDHPELSADQEAAARGILESGSLILCLTGVAGAGKTYLINTVRDGYARAGFELVGTAVSGCAAEELADKSGIKTNVLAYYRHQLKKTVPQKLWEHAKHHGRMFYRAIRGKRTWRKPSSAPLKKGQIALLEEASMINTEDTLMMLSEADRRGVPVLLVGDDKQLNAIGRGGPFRRIIDAVPSSFHLSENFRQRNAPEDAKAAADLRNGDVEKFLESYAKRGRLHVAKDRDRAAVELVKQWSNDGHSKEPKDAIILTQTREEARHLNRLCQAERRLDGTIKKSCVVIHGNSYHVGDRVLFHKQLLKHGVKNGYQGTVVSLNPLKRTMSIKLDREPNAFQAAIGRKQTIEVSYRVIEKDMLTLGYAATTHKMQGQSRKDAYCLFVGGRSSRNLAYVQATRGSNSTKLFTDRFHAGRKLADLAEAIRKPETNDLAHDQERGLKLRIEKKGDQA